MVMVPIHGELPDDGETIGAPFTSCQGGDVAAGGRRWRPSVQQCSNPGRVVPRQGASRSRADSRSMMLPANISRAHPPRSRARSKGGVCRTVTELAQHVHLRLDRVLAV